MSKHTSGILYAVVGTFLFSLKSIFIKLAYEKGVSTNELLLLRMLIAAPFYAFILYKILNSENTKSKLSFKTTFQIFLLGFIGYYLASYLDFESLNHIPAQIERVILFTYPSIIAVLAALFLGEKFTKKILISLILCYLGIWLMYAAEFNHGVDQATLPLGIALALGSALCYSLYVIIAKPLINQHGSKLFTSIAMLGSVFFVSIHFLLLEKNSLESISPSGWFYGALLAVFCTVIPSYMMTYAIQHIGASKASILGSAGPVFTLILASILLGEHLGPIQILGVTLVLAGVILISKKQSNSK